MSTTQSYGRWFVNYALLCATLLFAGHVTGEVSQWAGSVFGAANCDSYGYKDPGPYCASAKGTCEKQYNKCEMDGTGEKKWLCQSGQGVLVCASDPKCKSQKQDKKTNQCSPVAMP